MTFHGFLTFTAALGVVALPALAEAQMDQRYATDRRVTIEMRAGAGVPTFDIADAAKTGPSVGGGLDWQLAPRFHVLAEADFGFHEGADLPGGGTGPDINVFHFMGKLGYDVLNPATSSWIFMLNAGAGALTFDIDGGERYTYPAINVGAKIGYRFSNHFSVLASPQGDIAFSETAEVGTDNAWVWPFTAGVRLTF